MYEKTNRNTKPYGIRALSDKEMEQIAEAFSSIAAGSGVTLRTCAEKIDLKKYHIEPNSCIDRDRIEKIIGFKLNGKEDKQRENCQCIECADIGQYNTCKHGCRYCYANFSPEKVKQAVIGHDDNSPLLTGAITAEAKITPYAKAKSLKTREILPEEIVQTSLFDL